MSLNSSPRCVNGWRVVGVGWVVEDESVAAEFCAWFDSCGGWVHSSTRHVSGLTVADKLARLVVFHILGQTSRFPYSGPD